VPMNYGVNQGAVKGIAGIHTEEVSGWHVSDTLNDEALHSLFGKDLTNLATSRSGVLGKRIGELEARHREELDNAHQALQTHNNAFLRSGGSDPEAGNARRLELEARVRDLENVPNDARTPLGGALALAHQIGEIHREGAHRNAGTEPYKMPTRLAVLADLLGVKVAFNCKSGKDRTGELDAEVKHMKLEMAITGEVPHYKRERSPEEIRRFNEVVTNGGNQRMQELNTGFAGYKLKGVSALYKQFGGDGHDALTSNFHGMSHMTAT
jgi:Enterobacterial virulence protein IpgD